MIAVAHISRIEELPVPANPGNGQAGNQGPA